MGKLTVTLVEAEKKPGRYGDGDGLSLLVSKNGSKSWILRVHHKGKRRDIGLGGVTKVSLKQARKRAAEIRWQVKAGIGPTAERKAAGIPTFRETAARYYAEHAEGLKGSKEGARVRQWLSRMEAYAFSALGDVAINDVDESSVLDVLAAVRRTKPVTASRLREGIPALIEWAVGKGFREAPLAMANIDKALTSRLTKPRHHGALGLADVPAFMSDLRTREVIGRLALEALILTAGRICDVRGMEWAEVDLDEGLWQIPIKVGRGREERVHIVPLSKPVIDVLERARKYKRGDTDLVFRGVMRGKQLSKDTLWQVALNMGYPITAKGFRRTFAEWVETKTTFPREVREAALGRANPYKAEGVCAYLEERRALMDAWASYCLGVDGGLVDWSSRDEPLPIRSHA